MVESALEHDGVKLAQISADMVGGGHHGVYCIECGKGLRNKSRVKYHVLSHYYPCFDVVLPVEYGAECPECAKIFRDRRDLIRHFAFVHQHVTEVTGQLLEYFTATNIAK